MEKHAPMTPEGTTMCPTVVIWFKVYAWVLAGLYLLVTAMSLIFFLVPAADLNMAHSEAIVAGSICLALGVFFTAACLPPLVARPRPWLWVYSLVLICIGMTSPCFLPASIPLLIFWLKPEVKAYYGKE